MTSILIVIAITQCAFALAVLCSALIARGCGMRVDRVAIGFGRPLLTADVGETRVQLGMLLLGGFVQLAGRDASDRPVALDDARAFHNRPLPLRVLPPLAYPLMLTLSAGLVMSAVFLGWGQPALGPGVQIEAVVPG